MMRVECDEMKRREKQYMEQCQRDAEIKIQVSEKWTNVLSLKQINLPRIILRLSFVGFNEM